MKIVSRNWDESGCSNTSSVWNSCARFSHIISLGNQLWRPEMSAVFFGLRVILIFFFEYEQNEKNTVTYQCDVELQRVKKESEELSKDLADERKAHDTLRSVPRKPIT